MTSIDSIDSIDSKLQAEFMRRGGAAKVQAAVAMARQRRLALIDALLATENVSDDEVIEALARVHDVPGINLVRVGGDPLILGLLPKERAMALEALPLFLAGNTLSVAVADPENLEKLDRLAFVTGHRIQPVVALAAQLRSKLHEAYGAPELEMLDSLEFESVDEEDGDADRDLEADTDDRPVVRLVNLILVRALGARATDIHIEPDDCDLIVRFRVDGILERLPNRLPASLAAAVVSRLKVLSRLDISVRRRPQDGKLGLRLRDRRVDVRISTLPTIHGEKVVLRLLDKERDDFTLSSIGMHTATRDRWTGLLDRRDGLLVVTGPTGSGKTSTLYASLRHICSPEINIVTIEDPVEYEIPGATQIQVNQRTGLTFAEGLRSILRQDPDIILVGEIRDGETARIAVQAAMTGHLVLASMHTVDAPSAVARLVDLGVPPYLVAATLLGVVGQRLVRRSCPDCTGEALLSEDEKRDWKPWLERLAGRPQRSSGCKACAQRGYRGRIGVYELLVPTPAVRELVAEGASRHVLESAAVNASYAPMWLDGLDKVSHGLTSIYELSRHVAPPEPDNAKIIELPRPRSVAEIGHGRQS